MMELQFSSLHHFEKGPGESHIIPHYTLSFQMALEIDIGTQCGIGLPSQVLICSTNPPSIVSLSWTGDVNMSATTNLSSLDFYEDPLEPIAFITANTIRTVFGFVTLQGKAYICQRAEPTSTSGKKSWVWTGTCVYSPNSDFAPATTILFNPAFTIVAVGNLQGVVHLFELSTDEGDNLVVSYSHEMALTMPGTTVSMLLSPVTSLSWTPDGYALAVGWSYGGVSVWSVYGSLLMSTISEDTFANSSGGVLSDTNEVFFTGVQDLFWDPSGFSLFLLPASTFNNETVRDIFVLPFSKSSLLTCHSWSNGKHICLLGSDRILLYQGLQTGDDHKSMDHNSWETIHIPPLYLADNWPIKVGCY